MVLEPTQTTAAFSRTDLMLAAIVSFVGFLVYASMAWRLAQGVYFDYYNLAFDYDPEKFVEAFVGNAEYRGEFRHPLIMLLHPLGALLADAGLGTKGAAGLMMALLGALRLGMILLCTRAIGASRASAVALALLFAVSGVQVFLSMIAESYGPAMDALLVGWLVVFLRQRGTPPHPAWTLAAGVANFGITVSNIAQLGLATLGLDIAEFGIRVGIVRTLRWSLAVVAVTVVAALPIWYDLLPGYGAAPLQTLKEIYWAGQMHGPKTGFLAVIETFIGYSFVSPAYSVLDIPGGIAMRDFRAPLYDPLGWLTLGCWLVMLGAGTWSWLRRPGWRVVAGALFAAVIVNVLVHHSFQFRGSDKPLAQP